MPAQLPGWPAGRLPPSSEGRAWPATGLDPSTCSCATEMGTSQRSVGPHAALSSRADARRRSSHEPRFRPMQRRDQSMRGRRRRDETIAGSTLESAPLAAPAPAG